MPLSAAERQDQIRKELERNPYALDHELAELVNASIHTIRADRKALGIPDVRKRYREIAHSLATTKPRPVTESDVIGELLEVELDSEGISLLEATSEMAFPRGGIIRGHTLFAQANSLAAAIVDSEYALTAHATVQFTAAAWVGEKILGKARVLKKNHWKKEIEVTLKTQRTVVFKGLFLVYSINERMARRLGLVRAPSNGESYEESRN
jgi:acyl-coenzyme A thioesterase PaaI-like protein